MSFEFATAGRIVFGPGRITDAGNLASGLGDRALLVTGASLERAAPLDAILHEAGLETCLLPVEHEPTIEFAQRGRQIALDTKCDLVIGFGGGSAIDAGKAIAALIPNGGDPLDFLEVIGRGQPLLHPPLPFIAIPTTAGTGSESTRNAVLASPEHRVKVSLRSAAMLPRIALVDPELTHSMPPGVTATTGLDALTQVIEPFLSAQRNPLTDSICREGIVRAAGALLRAYQDGEDSGARQDMSLASLMGGLALANAGLGAVHGFAGPFGGMYRAPHGAICAALLPHVMKVNLSVLDRREATGDLRARFDEVACMLTGDPTAKASDGVAWLAKLCAQMQIPGLGSYGLSQENFPALIEKASVSSSMKGNPVPLNSDDLRQILELAL
ncbi:MAG: iron-containing alcohol dehydrogenase [Anaerolineales bacterium]|nr:MAG: iron-containing alcohol dehydrogenase [Anaerolineales bacterium]